MAAVPKTFAEDFELWAASLLEDGDTPEGIEEIRQAIRDALASGGDAAAYWTQRVANEATFIRSNQRQLLAESTETHL
jgi:hypothetical protein